MRELLALRDPGKIRISCVGPLRPSEVCLACLHADARFELLTGAWEPLLGFGVDELSGMPLGTLLAGDPAGPREALRRLLDRSLVDPIAIDVRLKSGAARHLRVYRRFEESAPSVYFACEPFEELVAPKSVSSFRSSAFSTL